MGILERMGDMKAERPTRRKMTTWVTLFSRTPRNFGFSPGVGQSA